MNKETEDILDTGMHQLHWESMERGVTDKEWDAFLDSWKI